jgi:biotin/methionine sulfoxide reductase
VDSRWTQTASHWGAYEVQTRDGVAVGARPVSWDADPSPIIHALPAIVQGPLRVAQPFVRRGYLRHGPGKTSAQRGADAYVAVGWDQALRLVEQELRRVRAEHGNAAIYGGSYGWASAGRLHHSPSLLKRFLGGFGGYVDKLGNHSFGAALGIMPYVVGSTDITGMATDWRAIREHTRLFICFGGIHSKNGQIDSGGTGAHSSLNFMRAARRAGVRFVNISPSRNDVAAEFDAEWIPIRPNTDTALMLALAHTLISTGRADVAFLSRYCAGYAQWRAYLLGETDGTAKDAAWAARICEVDASVIRSLCDRMVAQRTLLSMSWSIQRADHGEQPCWALVGLAAVLGQIGLPGGGFGLGYGAVNGIGAPRLDNIPRPRIPLGRNAVTAHVPVARITDMLLNPGMTIQYNGKPLTYPDIRLVYSCGGNPFHHNTEMRRVVESWRRPETIIIHEPWWTPAARHADIVLPATTTMERNDILAAELDHHWVAMKKVIDPVGLARDDLDVFGELAGRLGFVSQFTEGRSEMQWLRHMFDVAVEEARPLGVELPGFDEFWARGMLRFPDPAQPFTYLADYRADPVKNRLKTPSGKIELWSHTIEQFGYADCPPHPSWIEPFEWLGSPQAKRYPLHLLSHQPVARLHSQLDHSPISRAAKINEREPVRLHASDAAARDLKAGDLVRVFNDRGAFLASAVIDPGLRPGVIQVATGAWYDPLVPGDAGSLDKHGNPNTVTLDKGSSQLTQCPTAQTVLVEVQAWKDPAPPVTAFVLPETAQP